MTRSTLVLLPGLNNTAAIFDDVIEALGPNIDPISLTLPALDTVEALAARLLAELPERFYLCGFSFGGYVALAMLELAPERIAGLALVGALTRADQPQVRESRMKAIEIARNGGYAEFVAASAANAFHPASLRNAGIMAKRNAMVPAYGPERFVAHSMAALARPDRTEILAAFPGAVIMLAGESDPLAPEDKMIPLVGKENCTTFAGSGHLLPLEKPKELAAHLSNWLLR